MQKTSTPTRGRRAVQQTVAIKPKKVTIDLIKQFARVYTFSGMMPAGLGSFIAN